MTSTVRLVPATPADRRSIWEWLAQSDVTPSLLGPPHFPDHLAPAWEEFCDDYYLYFFDGPLTSKGRSFIIEANGEAAGHINYNDFDPAEPEVELDIWLRGEAYCGKGYGTAAVDALCELLRREFGCKKFFLAPSERNARAVHAYEKAGFRRTGERPRQFTPDYHDAVVLWKELE